MKKFVAILLCAAMLFGLCASGIADEKVTITWLHHFQEEGLKNWCANMADAYMEANPDVEIKIEIVSSDTYTQILKTKIAADDAPMIFDLDNNTITKEFANAGHLTDLTGQAYLANVDADNLKEATVDGQVWGITLTTCGVAVHYNKVLFDELGLTVPTTRSEFMAVCDTLLANGINPMAAPFGETWCISLEFYAYWLPYCWMQDIEWEKKKVERTSRFVDDEGFKTAFNMFVETKPYWGRDPFGTNWDSGQNMIANGEAAMMHNGSWAIEGIGGRNDACDIRIFPMPVTENPDDVTVLMRPGSALCVYNSPDEAKVAVALDFLGSLQTVESGTMLSEGAIQMSTVKGIDFSFSPALNDILMSKNSFNYAGMPLWNNEYDTLFSEVVAKYIMMDNPDVEQMCVELDQLFDSLV